MSSEILTGILGKRYKLQTSEKFDEYMKALGETTCVFDRLSDNYRDVLLQIIYLRSSDYFLTTMWDYWSLN